MTRLKLYAELQEIHMATHKTIATNADATRIEGRIIGDLWTRKDGTTGAPALLS